MKNLAIAIIAACSAAAAVTIAQAGQNAYVSDMAQAMPALKHGPVLHQADVDRLLRPQEIRLAPMEIVVEAAVEAPAVEAPVAKLAMPRRPPEMIRVGNRLLHVPKSAPVPDWARR